MTALLLMSTAAALLRASRWPAKCACAEDCSC